MVSRASQDWWESVFRNVQSATEANLDLQGNLMRQWYGLWPRALQPAEVGKRWSDSVNGLMQQQQAALQAQFRAVRGSVDALLGAAQTTADAVTALAAPAPMEEPGRAASEPGVVYPINIQHKVAVVTGAASGIGEAVSRQLAERGARMVVMVDRSERVFELAQGVNQAVGRPVAEGKVGDATSDAFRARVFDEVTAQYGLVSICVPAAGITRDALSVRIDKETGKAHIYPVATFREVLEVNLIAPIYWALEMVARIAEDRRQRGLGRWEPAEEVQGNVVFLGSVSSQGNKGQISYAVTKAGLEGAAATLTKEAIFHGIRCAIIHPGFTDTPMVRALGDEYVNKYVLPYTQLRRLIRPDEIADAICFMVANSAVSGELWADAGWHPPA